MDNICFESILLKPEHCTVETNSEFALKDETGQDNKDGEVVRDDNETMSIETNCDESSNCKQKDASNKANELPELIQPQTDFTRTTPETFQIRGRRVVDISFFVASLQALDLHSQLGCSFRDMYIVHEKRYRFKSCFIFKCTVCSIELPVKSEDDIQEMAVNTHAASEPASTRGHAQLEQTVLTASVPTVSGERTHDYHNNVYSGETTVGAVEVPAGSTTVQDNRSCGPATMGGSLLGTTGDDHNSLKQQEPSEVVYLLDQDSDEEVSESMQLCPDSSVVPAWTSVVAYTPLCNEGMNEQMTSTEHIYSNTMEGPAGVAEHEVNLEHQPRSEELPGKMPNSTVYHDGQGYYYVCNRKTAKNRLLRCINSRRGCHARASMGLQEGAPIVLTKNSPLHQHDPDLNVRKTYKLRALLKERSKVESTPLCKIFDNEAKKNPEVLEGISFKSMRKCMLYSRRRHLQSALKTYKEFTSILGSNVSTDLHSAEVERVWNEVVEHDSESEK